ncbi:unnamed protein product [Somion occarium]|uniref:UDP-glucose:glycoprotein glucosyltransferase n=1 Tax=Somion occarium TaxID=3059160 RepID=A0ABP1CXD4_9APHY
MKRTVFISLAIASSYAASPPVQVELRTSWPAPPSTLEILEAVAIERPDSFYNLLDIVTNPEVIPDPPPSTPQALHNFILNAAIDEGYLSGPGLLSSVQRGLGLHTASPKLETYYQFYADRITSRETATVCESWVDWYGDVICDVETLASILDVETIDPPDHRLTQSRPQLLPFDRVQPDPSSTLERPPHTAILYSSITSPSFRTLHELLYRKSTGPSPHIEYVFRPIPEPTRNTSTRSYLSGYGVALDLKKMEYLALDDRGQSHEDVRAEEGVESVAESEPIVSLLQQYPENSTADHTAALTPEELLQIGLQVTQLIYDSEEPLSTLKQLSQSFPKYASSVARRVTVDTNLQDEVSSNQLKAQGGISMAWLNGAVIPEKDMNPFTLLRLLRKERSVMSSLGSLGLSPNQSITLLTHNAVSLAQADSGVLDGIFDASDRPEGGDVIVWWNDFEQDSRYARWGSSIHLLLRPMYPGQFPNIKRNLFNIVLAVDLSQSSSLNFIAGAVSNIINRNLPFRFGVVPLVETDDGTRMARLFYWLIEHVGRAKTMEFIQRIAQLQRPAYLITPFVDWDLVRSEFKALVSEIPEASEAVAKADLGLILDTDAEEISATLEKARTYARRLGADLASAPQGHTFVNGKHFDLDDNFLRYMQGEVGQQMQYLQEQIYTGAINDAQAENIATYFYDLPEASKRRNKHIYPSGQNGGLRVLSLLELHERSGFPRQTGSFIYPPGDDQVPLTTYVVADLDSEAGLSLVKEALKSITAGGASRVTFIHNPSSDASKDFKPERQASIGLGHLIVKGLLDKVPPARLLKVLGLDHETTNVPSEQHVIAFYAALDDLFSEGFFEGREKCYREYLTASHFVTRDLKILPGQNALIVNGRVLGPLAPNDFLADDINALVKYELRKRVQPVVAALEDILEALAPSDRASFAELITMASSVVASTQQPDPSEAGLFNAPQKPRRRNYQLLQGDFTKFAFGDNSTALFHVGILLDPVSEAAQKWSNILEWLLTDPAVYLELHINPARYRELPLKRFYRYNLPSALVYDDLGNELNSKVTFRDLPVEPIYTLAMDVPQSWLARPREALYDLDNIQLGVLSGPEKAKGVHAVFDLDYLVIEGHARDIATNAPPRGLQLQLTKTDGTAIADTLVVANLGYLQFRTKPGVFRLEIRPGRGREIFKMDSAGNEGWDSPSVEEVGDEITLTSFEGLTLYPRVSRLPEMESVDVLAATEAADNSQGIISDVVSKLSSFFSSNPQAQTEIAISSSCHADINIFTVASGLLYERFASIMILSVLRNTKSSVKFWFIENFLSPAFLEFIPHFAEAYGFQYELVTYKWPSWLRQQKEKQRIIWAYKILFLDVLFPMDLKKVIFVDADQIVRTDLIELVNLDLHGAPYGYTPMGDDNVEMEGFRFWKTGYWKDFLQGLPYHISALYVVDLVRFRQMAAGDILRSHYQQLSADPHSLANLDQDLPNNLQREVPIYSLPEDWLWCETWCSKDRLHRAKTIDLCQNPLTKEPKLARARQIPEWSTYDAGISQFARSLADKGLIRAGIVAADANVLAEGGVGKDSKSETASDNVEGGGGRLKDEL